MVRLSHDKTTQAYVERRRNEDRGDKEIIRCLKRYVAREIYRLLTNPPIIPADPPSASAASSPASPYA